MYDRSGLGESSPDFSISLRRPITAQLVNSKLIKLLKRNHIQSPYILVSHSYGGMHAGYFARKYPDLVVGMLMVDPVPSNYQYSDKFRKQFEFDIAKWKECLAGKHISHTVPQDQAKTIRCQLIHFIN